MGASVDYHCRIGGAQYLAYPPVIAGGPRANTIHYINNNQLVDDGDMVLMDAGCQYHGYTSDLTRCWPANGKFDKYQQEAYEALLDVQLSLIEFCKQAPPLDILFQRMRHLLAKICEKSDSVTRPAAAWKDPRWAIPFALPT